MLTHNGGSAVAQQLVVVQQRAGDSVLDGGHANDGGVLTNVVVDLFKRLAADELQLLASKILVGSDVVKRPRLALYSYSLHASIIFHFSLKKNSPLSRVCEAGLSFRLSISLNFIRHDPLHSILQSKSNSRKSKRSTESWSYLICFRLQK
jgi:hypothetical protein